MRNADAVEVQGEGTLGQEGQNLEGQSQRLWNSAWDQKAGL